MGNYLAHDPQAVDPVWALASGHWDFIAIHPCDDGNGRAARWIANWMVLGYPLLVVTLELWADYLVCHRGLTARSVPATLAQARPLRDFLVTRLLAAVHFDIAEARGLTDPSYANETVNLHLPVPVAYTPETTIPRLRPHPADGFPAPPRSGERVEWDLGKFGGGEAWT